jgi:glycosyltransferase involved in cell wall biosynthesis
VILHLIETSGPGGAEQMLLRLAEAYRARGISQMVCLRKEGWLAEEVRRRGFKLVIRPLGRLPDLGWLQAMRAVAVENGVQALHAHEFAMNVRAAMLAWNLGVPAVATVHGKGYYDEKFARRLSLRLASRHAVIVAVSRDIQNHLARRVGIDGERIVFIPNGIDTQRYRFDAGKRRRYRSEYGLREDQVLLGTLGSYYPVKGHRYLIDAMRQLTRSHPDLQLIMAGQGGLEEDLRNQVAELNLQANVRIIGYMEDAAGFLSALDIFVMPSLSEGLPLSLLEAAAAGRCIVASAVGGIPEFLIDRENGFLVPPGDSVALAERLSALVSDSEKRFSSGARATADAECKWSIERTADSYLALLAQGKAPGRTTRRLGRVGL